MVPSNAALQQLLIAEFHNILVGGHVASSEHITISAGHSIGQTRKKKSYVISSTTAMIGKRSNPLIVHIGYIVRFRN